MSRKLFVGGVADGKWFDTNDRDYIRLARKKQRSQFGWDFEGLMKTFGFLDGESMETFSYVMQRWHADGEQIQVMVPEGQHPSTTLSLLIKNYKP
jgi:hypothetical protein